MFCRKCGRKLPDNASFCMYCGQKTIEINPRQPEMPQQPEEPVYEEPAYEEPYEEEPDFEEPFEEEPAYEEDRDPAPAPVQKRTQRSERPKTPAASGGRKGLAVLLVCIVAAAAVAGVLLFRHFRDGGGSRTARNSTDGTAQTEATADSPKALIEKWLSGNIDDLAGADSRIKRTAEEEAHIREMEELYGSFFAEEEQKEEPRVLKALLEYTDISLKTGFGTSYPAEVQMTVTGPDAAALMETLQYREYTSPEPLFVDMKNALARGEFEKKTTTVTVTLNQTESGEIYADRSEEAVRALYGGLIELNEQERLTVLKQLYEEVKGE